MKYRIDEYRKDELLDKLNTVDDIEKRLWMWIKQEYITLQEFRFILENIKIIKTTNVCVRIKDNIK